MYLEIMSSSSSKKNNNNVFLNFLLGQYFLKRSKVDSKRSQCTINASKKRQKWFYNFF
jgi:hypothetical protein